MEIRQVIDEAKTIADWIDSVVEGAGEHAYVLLRRLHEHLEAHEAFVPTVRGHRAVQPMTDVQAREFAKTIIPFGQGKGKRVGDVSLRYLCALADPSPFMEDLKRYLSSPSVRREIEETEA